MSDFILKVENIKKSFGGVKALKGVNLEIKKGEIHCLAGENGCGKSTLIKIISGFYKADEGSLEFNGRRFSEITPMEAIRQGVQVIYQDFSIFPNLTVMENLALNMELMNKRKLVNYKRFRKIAEEAVSKINFKVDLEEIVENLSVADKQLIAICRALLNDAKLIIMDEPTTSLNKKEVKALFQVIKNLQSQGIAILFVSHKLDEVFEISESYTIMRSGERVNTGKTSELDDMKFAFYMTGREFTPEYYQPKNISEEPVLEVKNLTLTHAFEDVSFELKKGEILGITGLLGSGRNELVQTLFGIYSPNFGEIKVNGKHVKFKKVKDAIKSGIGYVPPDRLTEGLFLSQSITNNIAVSKLDELSSKTGILKNRDIDTEIEKWINDLSVRTNNAVRPVQTLSGGNQQKVVLARWLATNLSVLILNGPTVGVDIGSKYDIHARIRELAERGLAVIIISDDLPEILQNCNRILVMKDGKVAQTLNALDTNEKQLAELSTSIS
ncbi:sugar ABC transporter ATP-binding protein [Bacillus sp. JJ1533]|uniref:sugar ABC transporter ATP-binding protein n=1 Tax=Bacillus sp. JJ1533 TaxID=3122959 RepID=UPI0030003881